MLLYDGFKIVLDERDPYELTYKGTTNMPIHRWVRLTPSFSPLLVSRLIKDFKCDRQSIVLDPFMGIGTTPLQCQFEGINSIGVDINPFLHYVATMKTSLWQKDLQKLSSGVQNFISRFLEQREKAKIPLDDFPKTLGIELPKLHNYRRWWREDVLSDLLIAKHVIMSDFFEEDVRNFLKMGLVSILMDVANVTYEGVQFTFIDRSGEKLDVFSSLQNRLGQMLQDVEYFQQNVKLKGETSIILGDSTKISELIKKDRVTCVITSPPYPNRYSYVWNTRPYLYFFDFFSEPSEAAELDKKSIGGTWGKATSDLQKGRIAPVNSDLEEIVGETVEKIRSKNKLKNTNLMANYVMKYFNMLYQHIESLKEILVENAKVAYVIGNSEIKGVEIPADVWLGKILEIFDFSVDYIIRARKRHSGKKLYEAIVIGTYR
jgi:tRNA G10  N-methylase Trm11